MVTSQTQLDTVVRGGTVITPERAISGWVGIKNGKIAAIGVGESGPSATNVIDATGKQVLPGIIDPEVHPGGRFSLGEALKTESRAAATAGITTWGLQVFSTVITPNRVPEPGRDQIPLNSEVFPNLLELGKQSTIDYYWTARITNDDQAREIPALAEKCGVISFKTALHLRSGTKVWYMWGTSKGRGLYEYDDGMIYLCMKNIAAIKGGVYCLHCENWEIVRIIQEELVSQGRKDMAAWCDRSPAFCEAGHVHNYSYYARVTGCPIYIMHVTQPETIQEIMKAKADGCKIYGQTAAQYLTLDKNTWKINVPLRDKSVMPILWNALAEGRIDSIGSDHSTSGRTKQEMEVKGDVWATQSGFPSRVEALLPLMLSEGVNKGRITLKRLVEVCSENPAKIFGLYPRKGAIAVGSDADLVLVDLNRTKVLTRDMVHSMVGWSMWEGWEIKGWPVKTILRGKVIAEWPEGEPRARLVGDPGGQYLWRGK